MVTIFLYTVLVFLSVFTSEIDMLGFFSLYDRYLLHFIYDKKEEDLLGLATNDYERAIKKVIF
jgi:hypothetical protein